MGLFGVSGSNWKKIGGWALQAAPYIAAPFTAGLSVPLAMGIKAGVGAATGAAGGGGWKGAAIGGGLGLIPGGSAAKGAIVPGLKAGLVAGGKSALKNVGTQAALGGGLAAVSKAFGGGKDTSTSNVAPAGKATTTGTGTSSADGGGGMDWGQWGPVIAQGAGAVAGGIASSKAQKSAEKRSPEELAALTGAQGAAGRLGNVGGSLVDQAKPYIQGPANYYQALLKGNRAAMTQAIAPGMAQVTGVYRGAEQDLNRQGVRGAQRDVAASELGREKASKIAGLTTGVQPYAAEKLAGLGTETLSQAGPMLADSGNIYGNLLTGGLRNREQAALRGEKAGAAWGGLVRNIGEAIPTGKGKKPATGVSASWPPPTPLEQYPY